MQCVLTTVQHVLECCTTLLPELHDLPVLLAVQPDDPLCLVDVDHHVDAALADLQCASELLSAHAVAQPKHTGLADEPLHLVSLGDGTTVDLSGELGVHIPLVTERYQQVLLSSHPCHSTCLDLRRVT